MNKTIILIAALAAVMSCGNKTAAEVTGTDSVASDSVAIAEEETLHEADTLQLRYNTYKRSNQFAEVKLSIAMPVAEGNGAAIVKSLWDQFDRSVTTSYGDGERMFAKYRGSTENLADVLSYYGKSLLASMEADSKDMYKEMIADSGDDEEQTETPQPLTFSREVTLTKSYESERYIVFSISWYGYEGGAHGGMKNSYYTYDKQTGNRIEKVLNPKCITMLQGEIKKQLCKYLDCKPSELFDNLMIEGKTIPMPQEPPYLGKDGVVFEYGQYEIGPYAMGMPTVIIPYDMVKDYLLVTP